MTQIRVELQLVDGSFTSGILRAGQTLAEFNQELLRTNPRLAGMQNAAGSVIRTMSRMDTSTKGALATLRDISVVTGLVSLGLSKASAAANGWLGDIVRVNAEMEKLNYQMRAMSTAADPIKDAANNVKYLREQATQMPFSLRTLTSGFTKLKAVGLDPANGTMKALADGISAFGGSDQEFNRTVLGITQAAGKGVLQMEELRQQIGESMPIAMNLLARSMGMTVGQLAKEISTGTVASIPALQKLTAELDRAYGGTAQRMMQTFSGQMTQLYTNLQNLATSEGGKGFFDQVKIQLREINGFLSSDMAQKMAVSFGQSLASIMQSLREGIATIWQFRDEIVSTGKVIAGGFGLLVAMRALSAFRGALAATRLELMTLSPAWAAAQGRMSAAAASFNSVGATAYTAGRAVRGMGSVISVAASGLAVLGPWITAAGVAAYAASEYFGILSDKIDEAYQELLKYGAESKKQAEDTVGAKETQLMERLEAMRKAAAIASPGVWEEDIKKTEEQLAALRKAAPQLIADAGKREIARDMERYRAEVSDGLEAIQREYNKTAIARDKAYADELAKADDAEEGKSKIRQRYVDDQIAQQKRAIDQTLAMYDTQIEAMQKAYDKADEADKGRFLARLDYLRTSRVAEATKLNSLSRENFDMEYARAPADEKKQITAGRNALDGLRADIAKLQANITGASGAVAEMNERIAAGDFGTIKEGGAEVEKLHQELLAAAEAKETLDKVMKGNQKADQDLAKIKADIAEKRLELLERQQGRELNDAQRMELKLDNGGYFGLGPYENIKKAIGDIVGSLNAQGQAADNVGTFMRQNAFGEQTVKQIDTVTQRIHEMRNAILGVGTSLSGLDFGSMGANMSGLPFLGANAPRITSFSGSMLELIAKGESGGNYNATLDNGKWTNGAQNLVGMTLNQIRDLQRHMLSYEENRMTHRDVNGRPAGSSALGKYQIVGQTLQGLMKEMGLSGNELFDEKMQDRMAMHLLNRRLASGEGVAGLRKEWTSLRNVSDGTIQGALNGMNNGPTRERAAGLGTADVGAMNSALQPLPAFQPTVLDQQVQKTSELKDELREADAAYKDIAKQTSDQDLADWIKKTSEETKDLGNEAEDTGKRYEQLRKAIRNGEFGKSEEDRNPEAERYKAALAAAKAYDDAKKQVSENEKLDKRNSQEAIKFEEKRVELNRRIAEMQNKVKDPKWVPDSSELQKLQTDLDGYVADVLKRAGGDTNNAAYKQALETRRNMLAGQRQLESLDAQVAFNKETNDLKNSLLTQSQLRQKNLQEELARVDTWLEQQRKNGANEVEITRMAEEQKALIRQKYQQDSSPMAKQFSEWSDLQNNLSQASARWMDSLAGGISDLIMGTGDLRSVIQGILKDIINMGVKFMMSKMFNKSGAASGGKGAGKGGGGKKAASVATGGKGKIGTAHTGGIIGSSSLIPKMAHSSIFKGASKFHTGGIVDGLLPSEVPIIAKKGEGVFTPEQMEALGGIGGSAQQFNVSSNITVNGSAGTPEQNTDLAKKMAREYEVSVRSVVADELRKQTKVGNYMNQRGR